MSIPSPLGDQTKEASMTIEGVELSFAQSMTVRVALETFALSLQEWPAGDQTRAGYSARLAELRALINRGAR